MIYLSGHWRPELEGAVGLGLLVTPASGYTLPPATPWGVDTGCYSEAGRKLVYDLDHYFRFLYARRAWRADCLFATVPDVVGNWEATWQRGRHLLDAVRGMGYPAAIVAQDGLTEATQLDWGAFDVFFVGGTDAYKLHEQTYELVKEARRRGKWTHMGRVNGTGRLKAAQASGYDSADGTKLAFGFDVHRRTVLGWGQHGTRQAPMWAEGA